MITPPLRELTERASTHARRYNDDADHTVAAALLTRSGAIVLGLNTYHFLGGPCGEISALSNHAASRPDDPVVAVVAAYGPTGDVISPCGKCRQVLFDLDPAIACIVRGPGGLEAIEVRELLPHAYHWRAADELQRIHMWPGYEERIRSGAKQHTIRVDDPFRVGPAVLVFGQEDGTTVTLDAEVNGVDRLPRAQLTEEHAANDGFASLDQLHRALEMHYPGLDDHAEVDVVAFHLT